MMEQYKELNDVARAETSVEKDSKKIWQNPKLIESDYTPRLFFKGIGDYDYPSTDFSSIKVKVLTSWNIHNKYKNGASFFEKSNFQIQNHGLIESRVAISSLKKIVNFAKEKGLV